MKEIKFNKQLFNTLLGYFLRGMLLIMPLALTIYIISLVIHWMDRLIHITIPGLGMIITLAAITLFGYLGTTFLVRSFFDSIERFVTKVPLISAIYTSFKEIIVAFLGSKKKFNQPVIVMMDKSQPIQRIGFITQQSLEILGLPGSVAVYIPHSYSFSGDLCIFPKEGVRLLANISSPDLMKFILSGGVTALQQVSEEAEPVVSKEEIGQ
jgi:uncharacterized membrane protein